MKLPKLTDLAPMEQRPCCPYCGKHLRPLTSHIQVEAGANSTPPPVPSQDDLRTHDANGIHLNDLPGIDAYRPSQVYRVDPFLGHWSYSYWTLEYQGYHGLFCTYWCGVNFAAASFKAGYRMNRTCPHTGRD